MATFRFKALEDVLHRQPNFVELPSDKISNFYGVNVFNEETMREYLPKEAYKSVIEAMKNGTNIDRSIADSVAASMKDWAISLGATHYTHWFQPLTGGTAEKHDAFFEAN